MNNILQYKSNGELENKYELSYDNLKKCNGMMSRIYLKNGDIKEYYLNTFDENKKVVELWLIEDNDDEIKEKINFEDIEKVESILHSHPRWGHEPYKDFHFIGNKNKVKDDFLDDDGVPKIFKEKHFYIYVEYEDMPNDKMYCYTSKDETIKKDDIVLVERGYDDEIITAKVINTKYYTDMEAPYPFSKLRYILRKLPRNLDMLRYSSSSKNIMEKIVARIIDEVKYSSGDELSEFAEFYSIDNKLSEDEIKNKIYEIERSNPDLEQEIIDKLIEYRLNDDYVYSLLGDNIILFTNDNKKVEGRVEYYCPAADEPSMIAEVVLATKDGYIGVNIDEIETIIEDNEEKEKRREMRKCACCDHFTLDKDSLYQICDICGWESDSTMEEKPNESGGANSISLNEARKNYNKYGYIENRYKLTDDEIELLKKYNIDYKVNNFEDFLINIDAVMTDYIGPDDEPTETFSIIEDLYDKIYYKNTRDDK